MTLQGVSAGRPERWEQKDSAIARRRPNAGDSFGKPNVDVQGGQRLQAVMCFGGSTGG